MYLEKCLLLYTVAVKDVNTAHCLRHPTTLDVRRTVSADIPSHLSLISVADYVEHLTDTAMGWCLSYAALFVSFTRQSVITDRRRTFLGTDIIQGAAKKPRRWPMSLHCCVKYLAPCSLTLANNRVFLPRYRQLSMCVISTVNLYYYRH